MARATTKGVFSFFWDLYGQFGVSLVPLVTFNKMQDFFLKSLI